MAEEATHRPRPGLAARRLAAAGVFMNTAALGGLFIGPGGPGTGVMDVRVEGLRDPSIEILTEMVDRRHS